jgi:hypothetical protein
MRRWILPTILLSGLATFGLLRAWATADSPAAFAPAAPAVPSASLRECNVTPEIERAVTRGLDYLAKTQQPDGSWGAGADNYGRVPGIVGLAVMAFLAHGESPDEGKYGLVIRKAVDYILRTQQANGLLSDNSGSPMYSHGFATLALAEVYGVIDDPRVGGALKRAVGLIVRAQNNQGGWRYSVQPADADTTVSGAQMMALRAAANAGIEVPLDTVKRGVEYYKSCFCDGGGFGYTGRGGPGQARAGIGMLVLCLSGEYRSKEVKATADWIAANSRFNQDGYGYYATYYCSQAMYQAGGNYWRDWNSAMTTAIIAMQQLDGSWAQISAGQVGDTAFALLSIEINYNLLPIYQR